jgi:hypothetical protein
MPFYIINPSSISTFFRCFIEEMEFDDFEEANFEDEEALMLEQQMAMEEEAAMAMEMDEEAEMANLVPTTPANNVSTVPMNAASPAAYHRPEQERVFGLVAAAGSSSSGAVKFSTPNVMESKKASAAEIMLKSPPK